MHARLPSTSDLPGGVVNLLTGHTAETGPWLASHLDVNALDLTGVSDETLAKELEIAAAENLKQVLRPRPSQQPAQDWSSDPGLERLLAFLEAKTVWHPKGL